MYKQNLQERNEEIIELVRKFCAQKLDVQSFKLAKRLIQEIGRKENTSFMTGRPEIWAVAIIQVVVKSNSLIDKSIKSDVSIDEINNFFRTNKFTTGKKSKQINDLFISTHRRDYLRKRKGFSNIQSSRSSRFFNLNIEHADFQDTTPLIKKCNFIKYPVWYGTNRKENLESDKVQYSNLRDIVLHLGFCEISIPSSHKIGIIERPNWFKNLFFEESPEDYFTIHSNKKTEEKEFIKLLEQKIGESDDRDVLLFIHGFNVEFDEAMKRTAQLGYDLNFKGAVTAFSWPSDGSVNGYVADLDSAKLSSDYLCRYLKLLISDTAKKLHIIAHSMGNIVLTQALLQLKEEYFLPNIVVNQIILAAPDIDKDIFINQIMPSINGIARITLYASNKDKALLISKKIRNDYERLGEGGENIVIVDGLESIDASNVATDLIGHGYFAETQSLLNDIHINVV